MQWYQQGDVLIKPVTDVPSAAVALPDPVLAEGEATGHRHLATGDDVAVLETHNARFLNAPNGAEITHEEHDPITVPPGKYQIEGVREYDYFAEPEQRTRRVTD